MLSEPANNPLCLGALERSVEVQLVFKHPFGGDDMSLGRTINQAPGTVGLESAELMFHSGMPVRISECDTDR